jgi:HSP20 family protein
MAQLLPESWQQALEQIRDSVHRVIDRWWHRQTPDAAHGAVEVVQRNDAAWSPVAPFRNTAELDIEETDAALLVTANVPELEGDHYTVEVSGERLIIRGEQKRSTERQGRDYYYAAQSYGAFTRMIPLPCAVDAEHAQAQYKQGVLRVTLPKTAAARAKRVKVQVQG